MSILSKSSAQWSGPFKTGRGTMKPEHGAEEPFSVTSRFEGGRGTNPEEMIGAALAGCFSMALSAALGQAGHEPETIDTSAITSLDKDGGGYTITKIALTTRAKVPGIDAAGFATIAEATKKACPVSKALAGTTITLDAALV